MRRQPQRRFRIVVPAAVDGYGGASVYRRANTGTGPKDAIKVGFGAQLRCRVGSQAQKLSGHQHSPHAAARGRSVRADLRRSYSRGASALRRRPAWGARTA